jgi:hypothetical protein
MAMRVITPFVLERAAALTPEPAHRAQRLLVAAGAKRDAGDLEAALGLLVDVEAGVLDELGRAQVDLFRAQIALEQLRPFWQADFEPAL